MSDFTDNPIGLMSEYQEYQEYDDEFEEIVVYRRSSGGKTKWAGMKEADRYQTIKHRKGDPYPNDMVPSYGSPQNSNEHLIKSLQEFNSAGFPSSENTENDLSDSGDAKEVINDDDDFDSYSHSRRSKKHEDGDYEEEEEEEEEENLIPTSTRRTFPPAAKSPPGKSLYTSLAGKTFSGTTNYGKTALLSTHLALEEASKVESPQPISSNSVVRSPVAEKFFPGERQVSEKGLINGKTTGGKDGEDSSPHAHNAPRKLLPASRPSSKVANFITPDRSPSKQSSARKAPIESKPKQAIERKRKRASDKDINGNPTIKKVKRVAWTDEEHNAIFSLIKSQRDHEKENSLDALKDNDLYGLISHQMYAAGFTQGGGRSLNSCRMYWQRYGRERAGYDEKNGVFSNDVKSTSTQGKKGKKGKRAIAYDG